MTRSHHAAATFTVTSWDESPVAVADERTMTVHGTEHPERGFTRADVTYAYSGDLEGTGVVAYLIAYRAGEVAPGFAFEQFTGSVQGHEGSFLLQHVGEHDAEGVRMDLRVVEGSGTGGLSTLRGAGRVQIGGHSESGYSLTLDYDL